jgi:hypothetical protein
VSGTDPTPWCPTRDQEPKQIDGGSLAAWHLVCVVSTMSAGTYLVPLAPGVGFSNRERKVKRNAGL